MTRTEARLHLARRQRRFEWDLARDEQARAAAQLVGGKTHDLLNLVQIVQLAVLELQRRCDASATEFLDDLAKAAADAQRSLTELMVLARPEPVIVRGAPVGPTLAAAGAALRGVVELDLHLALPPDTATRCTAAELEHLVFGLALDVAPEHEDAAVRVELHVRERTIDGKPWIELVRSTPVAPPQDRFELRVVEAIAQRAGGELATSDRRGGGEELVVALPAVP